MSVSWIMGISFVCHAMIYGHENKWGEFFIYSVIAAILLTRPASAKPTPSSKEGGER